MLCFYLKRTVLLRFYLDFFLLGFSQTHPTVFQQRYRQTLLSNCNDDSPGIANHFPHPTRDQLRSILLFEPP